MKVLFIMRHAKSSWDDPHRPDFERPLNERGNKAAPFIGALMRRSGYLPGLIISSLAARARQTAELAKEAGLFDSDVRFDERIYEASPHELRQLIAEIEDHYSSVLIVGHNPGIEGFIRDLTGQAERMPTAALAVVRFSVDSWSEIADNGDLCKVIRPKDKMI